MKYLAAIVFVLFFTATSFAQEVPEASPDWQLKALELQVQVKQLETKLRHSQEMARLYQFYIDQIHQAREVDNSKELNNKLKEYLDSKKKEKDK